MSNGQNNYPDVIFRFFREASYADAFASGNIWLSTLQCCRQYDDPLQGDSGEGIHNYSIGYANGGSEDADFVRMASQLGIGIGPNCRNITIQNSHGVQTLTDAFVVCTTEFYSPENLGETFGRFCVRIAQPKLFFELITRSLSQQAKIRSGYFGRVIYKDRSYADRQYAPGPLGFVKPSDPYAKQNEFRLLWTCELPENLTPFLLRAPSTEPLCLRIA